MPARKKIGIDVTQRNSVCIHASSVIISGKALLFLGHSTAGKSTISQLLSERYPVVADDKVWILKKKDVWVVCDGSENLFLEESSRHAFICQEKYPILAILRIFKSSKIEIAPISAKQACKCLMDAVFEVDMQRNQKELGVIKEWFRMAAEISKKINSYYLTFPNDRSIIKKIQDVFEK